MFYDRYLFLCKMRGISPSRAAVEMGINKGNVSTWKKSGYTPRGEALNKIAEYFGVSVDYLLTGEEIEKAPAQGEGDEMAEILEAIRRSPDLRAMFNLSKDATPEEVRQYINVIKAIRGED